MFAGVILMILFVTEEFLNFMIIYPFYEWNCFMWYYIYIYMYDTQDGDYYMFVPTSISLTRIR